MREEIIETIEKLQRLIDFMEEDMFTIDDYKLSLTNIKYSLERLINEGSD